MLGKNRQLPLRGAIYLAFGTQQLRGEFKEEALSSTWP